MFLRDDKENKPQLFSIFERSKVVKQAVSTVVAADAQITTASKTPKAITTEVKLWYWNDKHTTGVMILLKSEPWVKVRIHSDIVHFR